MCRRYLRAGRSGGGYVRVFTLPLSPESRDLNLDAGTTLPLGHHPNSFNPGPRPRAAQYPTKMCTGKRVWFDYESNIRQLLSPQRTERAGGADRVRTSERWVGCERVVSSGQRLWTYIND